MGMDSAGSRGWSALAASAVLGTVLSGCTSNPVSLGPPRTSALAAKEQAERFQVQGHSRLAGDRFREAASYAGRDGDRSLQTECLVAAGEAYLRAAEHPAALAAFTAAKSALEGLTRGNSVYRAGTLRVYTGLGDLDLLAGRLDQARTRYETALPFALGAARDDIHYRLSLVAEARGNVPEAQRHRSLVLSPSDSQLAMLRRALLPRLTEPVDVSPAPASPAPSLASARLAIYPRSTWSARISRSNFDPMGRVWRITVHHTGDSLPALDARDSARALQAIQRHHMDTNGWADIGYHFLIDASGRIWEGRSVSQQGAHAGSAIGGERNPNEGNIGVALLGDFSSRSPSAAQAVALEQLLAVLASAYHVNGNQILTHKEVRPSPTDCPGPAITYLVSRIRQRNATLASVRSP